MKGKFKKILAGITMGLVGAVALTGCSLTGTDLNINQAKLDKLIGGVDQYIEIQNSKQSAKEQLEYLLFKSKESNEISKGYQINIFIVTTNKYGIENENLEISQKVFMDEESKKFKYLGGSFYEGEDLLQVYDEVVLNEEDEYEKTRYNLTNKTYAQVEEFDSLGYGNYSPWETIINSILLTINGNSGAGEITEIYMKTLNNNQVQFDFMYWKEYIETNGDSAEDHTYYSETYSLVFENDKLINYQTISCYDINYGKSVTKNSYTANFIYNTGDFAVDTSECVLVENN